MKTTDLIEALQTADQVFQKKFGKPMEIFDLTFNEDDYDGDLKIHACGEVFYESDAFGHGSKVGKHPTCDIRVRFECEDEKIVDRSVEIASS